MRTTFLALLLALAPPMAAAQTNTTGTLSPNTTVTQVQSPTAPGTPTTPTAPQTAVAAPRDAAIIVCGQEFSTGTGRLLVFSASTNAGGPTVAPGAPCAQALSDLLVAGFGIIDVLPFSAQVQYTLVR